MYIVDFFRSFSLLIAVRFVACMIVTLMFVMLLFKIISIILSTLHKGMTLTSSANSIGDSNSYVDMTDEESYIDKNMYIIIHK